ncbi:hypothetical protein [Thioalbus denitrificans]|uniref:Uncharacterized protein n=1 Tax=Thioalbus denitrificans TaxID=547122 RepID=A0A369CKL1_9GAMM|nr:hypothetical protein [Thioalbus denitrificans]RCX33216.1 hypothetical protein DFQ59_101517 [Thioalbus denitrificans]
MSAKDTIRGRTLCFCQYHPDPHQARSALPMLRQVDGVHTVKQRAERCLELEYDLHKVSLKLIEDAMVAAGFHLDNSLMSKLKRSLYYYTEENLRTAIGCDRGQNNCVEKIFINHYARRPHGCRDDRPEHWRKYL